MRLCNFIRNFILKAGLDPYAKNENDYSSSMNIIDEEAGMEPEAFERFSQVCYNLVYRKPK